MLFIKKSKSFLQQHSIHPITSKLKKGTLHITGASCLGNTMIGTAKMIIGILSMSFFTCASALYTYAIVITKIYILYGISQTKNNTADQYNYYQRSGKLLVVAGSIYIIYSMILLFHPVNTQYNKYMAIAIACFTFSELGLNIRGIIVERKNKMPLFHALQIVNLASSCICLVLTQTAILAFTSIERGVQHNISSNGFIGVLMGTLSTVLGIYLVIHSDHFMYGKDIRKIHKLINKIMKKENLECSFRPLKLFLNTDGTRTLVIECTKNAEVKIKKDLYENILRKLNIVIINKNDIMSEMEEFL